MEVAAPLEPPVEVVATTPRLMGLDVATLVSEGMVQSVPPAAQAAAPEVGRMEGDTARGSSGVMVVVERTSGGSPLALMSGGNRSPTQGESLLQWMDPQDPTSILFSLDDAAESIDRESLNGGILAMMEVLN